MTARSVAAAAAGLLAVATLVGAIVGLWALRTATDSGGFERQVESLLERDEISDALAQRVVAETVAAVGIEQVAADLVPDSFAPALQLVLAGVRSRVEDRLGEIIRTPEVARQVAAAAGRAHRAAIDVLEGEPVIDGVEIGDGDVRINLLPLTARTIRVLQEVGLFADVVVPELVPRDPEAQLEQLELALDRDLPPRFGQPVVYRSERLDEAGSTVDLVRDLLLVAKRTCWLLAVVGLGATTLSIWLSSLRWRTASFLVAGLFAASLVMRVVVARAAARLPEAVDQPGAKFAVRDIAVALQRSLDRTMLWCSAAAVLVLVGAAVAMATSHRWASREAAR